MTHDESFFKSDPLRLAGELDTLGRCAIARGRLEPSFMNRILALFAGASLAVATAACTPEIPTRPPPDVVVARFDPAQTPPVVPTPNSLAIDRSTGLLNVSPAPGASPADLEFVAWLNTLNGFPAGSSANVTFTGELDPNTVGQDTLRVFDLAGGGLTPVDNYSPTLTEPAGTDAADAKARVNIPAPTGGWTGGHSYAVAVLGGANGLKGADGRPVVGSSTWALVRSENPLFTCEDLDAEVEDAEGRPTACRATTEIIPSEFTEPNERIVDQARKAARLEGLRRLYKPIIDALIAGGVDRQDIALLWTFKVADVATALFNPAAAPPQVPVPNDLAIDPATGLVKAPIDPTASEAQQEFTRDYINTLDGFPVTATGSARIVGRAVRPATVNGQTVRVLDLTAQMGEAPLDSSVSHDPDAQQIVVTPPATGWRKGRRYAVVLTTDIVGDNDAPLAANDIWALARSEHPLVDCEDLTSPACRSVLTMAPISHAQAVALEGLRRSFKPALDGLAAQGLPRTRIALMWTFRIVSFAEATFDPGAGVIPFPNNLLLTPGNPPKVNLPIPADATPLQTLLLTGLNTLDGFSTIGPYISENSAARGALDISELDPETLEGGTGFIPLAPGANPAQVTACLNCWSSEIPGNPPTPQTTPQQLQFVTEAPLDEKTPYGAYLTSALRDVRGKKVVAAPAFALMRMEHPLVDADGKSQVAGVSDANAAALEPLRQGHKAFIDGLVAQGVQRRDLALAWTLRTQSTVSHLNLIHDTPAALGQAGLLSNLPLYVVDVTGQVPAGANVGKVLVGELRVPHLLSGPGGTLNPSAVPTVRNVPFLLTLPAGTPPASGWPVVIFGHGLRSGRQTMLGTANAFAGAGQASIAIDHLLHGDRSDCRGSAGSHPQVQTDNQACASAAQVCATSGASAGRCVAASAATRASCSPAVTGGVPGNVYCANIPQSLGGPQGRCMPDEFCEGGDFARNAFGVPLISGWNFLDPSNLFATRDRLRAPVADLAQLARVVAVPEGTAGSLNALVAAQGGAPLDAAQLRYAGQSLGGIIGTLYTAASGGPAAPAVEYSLLNVPGADLAGILLSAPAFQPVREAFIAALAAQGILQGTPEFDSFIHIARWILDPSDPQSAAYAMLNSARAPASRAVLVQYITQDQVIPQWTTERLIRAANRGHGERVAVSLFDPPVADLPLQHRHSFLNNPVHPATTLAAQQEAAALLANGTVPPQAP
jgi:hypothetical protein